MEHIPLPEVEGRMAELMDRVACGEEIVILRNGSPAARLIPAHAPVHSEVTPPRGQVRFGLAKGQIWVSEDFDAPLPDDLLKAFYGVAPGERWPDDGEGTSG